MKNHNKANACQTQIADISTAGKELSEEHLRIVGGGLAIGGISIGSWRFTNKIELTCAVWGKDGWCSRYQTDSQTTGIDPTTSL